MSSEILSHCCTLTCSIPKNEEPEFNEPCQDHNHTKRCDYCDIIPQAIQETKRLIEVVRPIADQIDKITCEEMTYDLNIIEEAIEKYKNQQRRNYIQATEWQRMFEEKKPEVAYVTCDFQMKIVPRKSDEAQSAWFGKV